MNNARGYLHAHSRISLRWPCAVDWAKLSINKQIISIYLSIYPSTIHPSIHLSIYLSVCIKSRADETAPRDGDFKARVIPSSVSRTMSFCCVWPPGASKLSLVRKSARVFFIYTGRCFFGLFALIFLVSSLQAGLLKQCRNCAEWFLHSLSL